MAWQRQDEVSLAVQAATHAAAGASELRCTTTRIHSVTKCAGTTNSICEIDSSRLAGGPLSATAATHVGIEQDAGAGAVWQAEVRAAAGGGSAAQAIGANAL